MKGLKTSLLVACILLVASLGSLAQTTKLEEIGRYTFVRIKGNVPTARVMKTLLDTYAGDIKIGFGLAAADDLYLPFMEQIKQSSFVEKELARGTRIKWMFFRSRGKVKVAKDLEWAGAAPLPVFSFTVRKGTTLYEFVMPRPCGNIALLRVEEAIPDALCDIRITPAKANINDPITVDMSGTQNARSMEVEVWDAGGNRIGGASLTPDSPKWQTTFTVPGEYKFKGQASNSKGKVSENGCEGIIYINFPPESQLNSSWKEGKGKVGQPITLDATQSSDPDGKVVKAVFEARSKAGTTMVERLSVSSPPLTASTTFNKKGIYLVTATVTDDFGAQSRSRDLELTVVPKKLFFLAEAGPLFAKSGSYTTCLFGQVGLHYQFVPDRWSFSLSAGPAFPIFNTDGAKTFLMADGLLNLNARPFFIGAGLGFTGKDRDTRPAGADILGQAGIRIFGDYKSQGALFLEMRIPVGRDRRFSEMHKLLAGFRLLL